MQLHDRECVRCKSHFLAWQSWQIFCSGKCYQAESKVEIKCKICGKIISFDQSRIKRKQKYLPQDICSRKCYYESLAKTCKQCGIAIKPWRTYCSRQCQFPKRTKECLYCGKKINTTLHRPRQKYCCLACKKKHMYGAKQITLTCTRCGKSFIRKKWQIKETAQQSYCSRKCFFSRSPKITYTCECGKSFLPYSSRRKYYHILYCSNQCREKYAGLGIEEHGFRPNKEYEIFTRKLRHSANYLQWKKACLERDQFRCTYCGSATRLIVHHKVTILNFIQKYGLHQIAIEQDPLFFDIDNGITQCRKCHVMSHRRNHHD